MSNKYYLQGRYSPVNPEKYKGDIHNIIYRSSWERKFLYYCDMNESVLEYSSEEKAIPYRSPMDGKVHRYYPDFLIKVKDANGFIKKYMIEIKPEKKTIKPQKPQRQTKKYINEVYEYAKNQAKWDAAKEWCADHGYEFKVITEKELF